MNVKERIMVRVLAILDGLLDWATLGAWSRMRGARRVHYSISRRTE